MAEAQRDPAEALSLGADGGAYWLDESGETAVRAALTAYYEYQTSGDRHRRQVFDWQLTASKINFRITVVLVSAGLLLSLYQFRAGMRASAVAQDTVRETLKTAPPEQVARLLEVSQASGRRAKSDLELSMTGVKVGSDVVGLIILVISLAFFCLYRAHVYPITEIAQATPSQ